MISLILQQYPQSRVSKLRHDLCSRDRLQLGVGSSAHLSHNRDLAVVRISLNEGKGGLPMKPIKVQHKLTYWQRVFLQSKVNGASYNGEALPGQVWCWPKNTYLQSRLQNQQESAESIPPVRQKVVIEARNNRAH
jgi:hypothetical protein